MKKVLGLLPIVVLILSSFALLLARPAFAYSNSDLIDDSTFDNTSSMSASQIDSWLNGFSGSCISPNSGFTAPDPTGYSPDASFMDGNYTYGSPVTAGHVIYDAAVAHSINPQVLITKLENEEGLVKGDGLYGCSATAMASATGYACTDGGSYSHSYSYSASADPYTNSGALVTPLYYLNGVAINSISKTCVNLNTKAGFSEQVVHAAWLLSFSRHKSEGQTDWAEVHGSWDHCEDNDSCPAADNIPSSWACYSGYMTQGSFKSCPTDTSSTYYDGYATIDGQAIHMGSGATAALYVYTPHIQSFDSIFTPWFGNPTTLCAGVGNLSGVPSGQELFTTHFASSSPSQLTYAQLNNTGSTCAEVHTMNTGSDAWRSHSQTVLRALDPSTAEFLAGDFNGDGKDELLYIVYDGPGHVVNIRTLNSSYTGYVGGGAATPLSGFDPTKDELLAADLYGNGRDELIYVVYNGPGNALNFRVLNSTYTGYLGVGVKTALTNFDPTKSQVMFGDMNGDGKDEMLYAVYDGPGGVVNLRTLSANYSGYAGSGSMTPLANFNIAKEELLTGDMNGNGRDQLLYVVYCGPGNKVNMRTLNRTYTGYSGSGVATPLSCYTPSS